MRRFSTFACIDWSGAAVERPGGIAIAVVSGSAAPQLVRPDHRWSRAEALAWLIDLAARDADILIGVDLSPALPFADAGAYFPALPGSPPDTRALWALVDNIAAPDRHLGASTFVDHPHYAPYFRRHGGREGAHFGGGIGRLRLVEQRQRSTGQARSASCFNLVGAAQVGKASLTGMRLFHRLGGAIPFWPFDPVPRSGPLLVEIYTSLAARVAGVPANRSKIRDAAALTAALAALGCPPAATTRLDDHATDALVTAAWLRAHAADPALWQPSPLTDHLAQTEGWTFGVI